MMNCTSLYYILNPLDFCSFCTELRRCCCNFSHCSLNHSLIGCVGGVGVIFLAWGLLDFGTGYSAHDTTQQSQAIKKVIGGLVMIAVPAILKLLGVS